MLGVFAEFETDLRRERQLERIAAANARGAYKGRKRSGFAVPKDRKALDQMAWNKDSDQVWDIFQQFATFCSPPIGQVMCWTTSTRSCRRGRQEAQALGLRSPSAVIVGRVRVGNDHGCLLQAILCQLWSASGVEFRPHQGITRRLRYTQHQNGELLTIHDAVEEDWSKCYRDKPISGNGATIKDRIVQRLDATLDDTQFVWMGNKDIPDAIFGRFTKPTC
jgi:hypothetical protein